MALAAMFSQARDKQQAPAAPAKASAAIEPIRKVSEAEVEEFCRRVRLNQSGQTDDVVSGR